MAQDVIDKEFDTVPHKIDPIVDILRHPGENIDVLSDIEDLELVPIQNVELLAKELQTLCKCPTNDKDHVCIGSRLYDYLIAYMRKSVSRSRKGRKEMENMFVAKMQRTAEQIRHQEGGNNGGMLR